MPFYTRTRVVAIGLCRTVVCIILQFIRLTSVKMRVSDSSTLLCHSPASRAIESCPSTRVFVAGLWQSIDNYFHLIFIVRVVASRPRASHIHSPAVLLAAEAIGTRTHNIIYSNVLQLKVLNSIILRINYR
ncbi:unnamed protein product [Aphis gossypii]|uniref:Uncharacterized protein n=1 Tax=Aphis gossypii TaxID=80765 RepID=A0A9P0JA25_APHGO|nr:unnamed protein product [Aphis gossypii]